MKLINNIKKNLINIPGWRTNRKIVVFESDDWGSIRMSSKKSYDYLVKKGYPLYQSIYNSNDILESNNDLERLFEVLSNSKDYNGNSALFTINNIVANPDFNKIKNSNYQEYYFEPFTETLKKYPKHDRVMNLYLQGINNKLIKPQFHGREHVHVPHWLKSLQSGDVDSIDAFNNNMFTINSGRNENCRKVFLDAMGTYSIAQLKSLESAIKQGSDLFEEIWGYRSKTVIPSCYVWHSDIELFFRKVGINVIQSSRVQLCPQFNSNHYKVIRRYTGQKSDYNLNYTIRNVIFEPSENQDFDWVNSCLSEIKTAFFWKKPAIISTHRVNYMAGLNMKNADNGLFKLQELIKNISRFWPDVEFLSSDQLSDIICKGE